MSLLLQKPIFDAPHLGIQWISPHPALVSWIQCYWHLASPNVVSREILFPDGGSTLYFYLYNNALPKISFESFYTPHYFSSAQAVECVGVRFYPGGAFQLLQVHMGDVKNNLIDVEDLCLPDVASLQFSLASAISVDAKIQHIEHWLLHLAKIYQPQIGLVQKLLPKIVTQQFSVEQVVSDEHIHRRKLERLFQQQVGLAPNKVKLLFRLKHARRLIKADPYRSLTDIALESGFFDQAHFTHQFQQMTGETPSQYKARKMSQKYNAET